jgi:hypothetical protein
MTNWEEYLLALDESRFFNLVKNYILSLETPYNKQGMIVKLSTWMTSEENSRYLIDNISPEESEILSVIYYLNEVPREFLPLDWDDKIKENLEERLLIFPQGTVYRITPVLEPLLIEEGIISLSRFLEWSEDESPKQALFTPDDMLLTGFLSWFSTGRNFFLNDRSPRRRSIEELQEKIPFPSHLEDSFFTELADLFIKAGLLKEKDKTLQLGSYGELESFEKLDYPERMALLASLNTPGKLGNKLGDLLSRLREVLKGGSITLNGWCRLQYLLSPRVDKNSKAQWSKLPRALSLLGLCTVDKERIGFPHFEKNKHQRDPLLVQPNGDIDVPPHSSFSTALALSCELEKGGNFYRYHLTRESFERGLRKGLNGSELIGKLEELSQRPVPENLVTTIEEWEKQLSSLRIVPGIILNVTGFPERLLENNEDLQEHVSMKIADQWFLMKSETEPQWRALLQDMGLFPFEEIEKGSDMIIPERESISFLENISLEPVDDGNDDDSSDNREKLESYLTELSLPEELDKEFRHRISRGVVLFKEQLDPAVLRQEVRKAGGLDFNSKLRLISHSFDSRSPLLEIRIPQSGSIVSLLIIPLSIENSREDSLLKYKRVDNGEEGEIAVRKILEVLKFHGSLLS